MLLFLFYFLLLTFEDANVRNKIHSAKYFFCLFGSVDNRPKKSFPCKAAARLPSARDYQLSHRDASGGGNAHEI